MNDYTSPGFVGEFEAHEWQALLDYANDQVRPGWGGPDLRHPCSNPTCSRLTEALYCQEGCRIAVEGDAPEADDSSQDGEGCLLGHCAAPTTQMPLGEAPVSMNVHVPIQGRDVLITLRGTDEGEVLARLEALLARYPVAQAPAQTSSPSNGASPTCPIHQVPLKEQHGKDGSTWRSHKTVDGWCKGRERQVQHG
jgi:hypothetical protein